jgi:hypothetical protein
MLSTNVENDNTKTIHIRSIKNEWKYGRAKIETV